MFSSPLHDTLDEVAGELHTGTSVTFQKAPHRQTRMMITGPGRATVVFHPGNGGHEVHVVMPEMFAAMLYLDGGPSHAGPKSCRYYSLCKL